MMNTDNLRNFVKDIFTLRTVWIDKGRGRWAVKKRLHPLMKTMLCTLAVILSAVIYSGLHTPEAVEAEPKPVMIAAKLPEPEKLPVPEPVVPEVKQETVPPEKPNQSIIIPLATKNTNKSPASTIILPSEVNPEIDRIVSPQTIIPANKPEQQVDNTVNPANKGKYSIRVNKSEYTLTLYKGTEPVKTYLIAIGKNPGDKQRVGDNRTPNGNFKIVSIENASSWTHDFRDGKGKISGAYGPWFLRLDAKGWKGIGIHGTHAPDSLGTMATEGCIRLSNDDIAELKQYAYRNMPVIIREN